MSLTDFQLLARALKAVNDRKNNDKIKRGKRRLDDKLEDRLEDKVENNLEGNLDETKIRVGEVKCSHTEVTLDCGAYVCIECGEEVSRDISTEKEWRWYDSSKSRSNPNRVQARKTEDKSIHKDVENLGFPAVVVDDADKMYTQVTQGKIFRGISRKSIIFACIFHSLKKIQKPVSHDKLSTIFNLSRKAGLKGLKHVNLNAPKACGIKTSYITADNIAGEIMDVFSANEAQKKEVADVCKRIKNRSSRLNRSRPKSVACAVVYYWIRKSSVDITLKKFASTVELSELTILKIAKEIISVLKDTETEL